MAEKPIPIKSGADPSPVDEALSLVQLIAERSAAGLGDESSEEESSAFALQQAISQGELAERLRLALVHAASKSSESMEALRIAVCAFTVALRDEGVTPEAVLISLKAAIRKQTLIPLWEHSTWSSPSLSETMSTWCIKHYFGDKDCTD